MTWNPEIKTTIDRVLKTKETSKLAVFDADGTLWHDDLGEAFFKHQIEKNLAPGLRNISQPWAHYRQLCARDATVAYGWLAQINASLSDAELTQQAEDFYNLKFRSKFNPEVKDLIYQLRAHNFQVWICTASIRWAIAPALKDLDIDTDLLIGAEVELDKDKILTNKIVEPVPYKAGKKYWLEKKLKGKPLLVAGNSMGDLEMMAMAKVLPLTIVFEPHLPEIRDSEIELMAESKKRTWPIQIFR